MIDKLELRVSERTKFTTEFNSLFLGLKFHSARHYKIVADLRPYDYDAILHYCCKRGEERNHKLELIDTSAMTLGDMKEEVQRIFQVQAGTLSIMRLDLAVDVEGIGVPWFQEHTRVRYKRWLANIGIIDTAEMGNREIQTLYYGKRPNMIRIYNKVEEYRAQYQRILRRASPDAILPTFLELFRVPEFGHILTRIERQMGGGKIPAVLATVDDLRNCAEFDPFAGLEFISGGKREPNPNNYTFMEYSTGMHLRHLAETRGMQAAITHITRHSKRNKAWAMKKFADFLPVADQTDLTGARLFERFQQSIASQLKNPQNGLKFSGRPLPWTAI